jgi:LytS/YehU family sensor histidine kinase
LFKEYADKLNKTGCMIKRHKQVMEEKLQTELQLVKAQINPYFLFNALNDIYSLTYMKSEKPRLGGENI